MRHKRSVSRRRLRNGLVLRLPNPVGIAEGCRRLARNEPRVVAGMGRLLPPAAPGRASPGVDHRGLGKAFPPGKGPKAGNGERSRTTRTCRACGQGFLGQGQAFQKEILPRQPPARRMVRRMASTQGGPCPNPRQLSGPFGGHQGSAEGNLRSLRQSNGTGATRVRGIGQDGCGKKPREVFLSAGASQEDRFSRQGQILAQDSAGSRNRRGCDGWRHRPMGGDARHRCRAVRPVKRCPCGRRGHGGRASTEGQFTRRPFPSRGSGRHGQDHARLRTGPVA